MALDIPYNPVPTVEPTLSGTGARPVEVPAANPNAFGAQIGEGLDKVSSAANDLGQKYTQMANEAAANDVIANQFVPKVTQLAGDYYKLQGKDAIAGFQPYVNSLQQTRSDLLQNLPPAQANLIGSFITRHVTNEYDTAMRHQTQQMNSYEDQTHNAMLDSLSSMATQNYNQPTMVDTNLNSGLGLIEKYGIDHGQGQDEVNEKKRQFTGKVAQDMIGRAVTNGDLPTAQSIYKQYGNTVSGPEQLELDKMMHAENIRQFAINGVAALHAGQPIPAPSIGTPVAVKAVVADTAQKAGVDPSQALTVASIESDFGQNVGKRGDIGQTGKGGDIPTQAQNLVTELQRAKPLADTATGRQSEPWEQYVVYQQGAAGGPALLKATQDNPTAKAVDVLQPFYSSPKEALSAVANNGGNATMTAGQFLDMIKTKYNTHAQSSALDIPPATTAPVSNPVQGDQSVITTIPPQSPGQAILAPHQTGGIAMQPSANPVQALHAENNFFPDAMARAMSVTNPDQRSALMEGLKNEKSSYEGMASSYIANMKSDGVKMMVDPKFNIDQLPPPIYSTIAENDPQLLIAMQNRSRENAEKADPAQKDALEKGPAFYRLNVGTEYGAQTPTTLESINQAYNDKQINSTAQDYLISKINGKKDADPNEASYKTNIETLAKNKIGVTTPENTLPENMGAYSDWKMAFDAYVEKAHGEGKPLHEIYDSKGPVSKLIDQFTPGFDATMPGTGKKAETPTFFQRMFSSQNTAQQSTPIPPKANLVTGQTYDLPQYGKAVWNGTTFVQQAGQ